MDSGSLKGVGGLVAAMLQKGHAGEDMINVDQGLRGLRIEAGQPRRIYGEMDVCGWMGMVCQGPRGKILWAGLWRCSVCLAKGRLVCKAERIN